MPTHSTTPDLEGYNRGTRRQIRRAWQILENDGIFGLAQEYPEIIGITSALVRKAALQVAGRENRKAEARRRQQAEMTWLARVAERLAGRKDREMTAEEIEMDLKARLGESADGARGNTGHWHAERLAPGLMPSIRLAIATLVLERHRVERRRKKDRRHKERSQAEKRRKRDRRRESPGQKYW